MGSQLISNAVRSFFLAMVLTGLLAGSVAEAASYQKTDGTIVNPIVDIYGIRHSYRGTNLEPGADLSRNVLHQLIVIEGASGEVADPDGIRRFLKKNFPGSMTDEEARLPAEMPANVNREMWFRTTLVAAYPAPALRRRG